MRGRGGGGRAGGCTGAPSRPFHWPSSPQASPGVREGQVLSAVPPRVSAPEWLSDLLWLGEVLVRSELGGGKQRRVGGAARDLAKSSKIPLGRAPSPDLSSRRVVAGWKGAGMLGMARVADTEALQTTQRAQGSLCPWPWLC